MRRIRLAALMLIAAAAALIAIPSMPASAAPVSSLQGAVTAAAGNKVTIPVHLTPGTHTVSEEISLTAGAHSVAGSVISDPSVSIRVGKNDCGGYNGNISWGVGYIETWGTIWDDCDYYTPNTTVYLYLTYSLAGTQVCYSSYCPVASVSGYYASHGVNYSDSSLGFLSPSGIELDLCLKWNNGWGCGPPESF